MTGPGMAQTSRFATARLLFDQLFVTHLATLIVLSSRGPEAVQTILHFIFLPVGVLLILIWWMRSLFGARSRRLPLSASPLHRLHEWAGPDDSPDSLASPEADTYADWNHTLAGRLVHAWGKPSSPLMNRMFGVLNLAVLVVWLAIGVTLWVDSPSLTHLWDPVTRNLGIPLWVLLVIAAGILTILRLRLWASRTFDEVQRR